MHRLYNIISNMGFKKCFLLFLLVFCLVFKQDELYLSQRVFLLVLQDKELVGNCSCVQYKLYLSLSSSHHTDVDALEAASVTSLVPAAAKACLKYGWTWHSWWVKAHRWARTEKKFALPWNSFPHSRWKQRFILLSFQPVSPFTMFPFKIESV